jgi:DedD protein
MSPLMNNTDDDLTLRTRRAAAAERSSVDLGDSAAADREVTLNTGTVLGLFFALALLCAVFFGFGYSMGRKSGQATAAENAAAAAPADPDSSTATSSSAKPSAVTVAPPPVPGYVAQGNTSTASTKAVEQLSKPAFTPSETVKAPNTTVAAAAPAPHVPAAVPVVIPPVSKPPVPSAALTSAPAQPGATYVQIAAVSHQEDADVLVSALRRRGYTVLARNGEADHLIHVQIGPFGNRKDAEAMRQKLLGDGYNAFLK